MAFKPSAIAFLFGILIAMIIIIPIMWVNCNVSVSEPFVNGCQNIPNMFKKMYDSIPNEYKPAGTGIPTLPLGANSTMVFNNVGGCASNVNGVNKVGERYVSTNTSYCTRGSNNPFNM